MKRSNLSIVAMCAVAVTGGCAYSAEPPVPASLELLSGGTQAAAVAEPLPEPVVLGVRTTAGQPVPGVVVQFSAGDGSSVTPASAVTDGSGRATATWHMGTVPGEYTLRASLAQRPEIMTNVTATARHGPAASVRVLPDTLRVVAGVEMQLGLDVSDRFGNAITEPAAAWSNSNPDVAAVSATGGVTAVSMGNAIVTAVVDGVAGTAFVQVAALGGPDPSRAQNTIR
jgi:hypothetical protein